MRKRIIVKIEGNKYIIAVNTEQGTIPETVYRTESMLMTVIVIRGYFLTFEGDIEIHPGKSLENYKYISHIVNEWGKAV